MECSHLPPPFKHSFKNVSNYTIILMLLLQDLFVKHGGTLQECEQVLEIIPGTVVTVKTNKGTYTARHLVLTPGPWASGLMLKLGLKLPLRVRLSDLVTDRADCAV